MSVELYRGSPGKFDSRTLDRKTPNRWTGRTPGTEDGTPEIDTSEITVDCQWHVPMGVQW